MLTKWGETIDPAKVLPEYPRPQMARAQWTNLNGVWQASFTSTPEEPAAYDLTILVPFSPETPLSGVGRALKPGEYLWYRRVFLLPEDGKDARTLLHFGAVDQQADVFVNGLPAGRHEGGYLAFTIDITELLHDGENVLTVRVTDDTDASYRSRGKQKTARGGIWYTPQSGIWQTVWLECVPQTYVHALKLTPRYDEAAVDVLVMAEEKIPYKVIIIPRNIPHADTITKRGITNSPLRIEMPGFLPWSPENPQLYDVEIEMGEDRVSGYFGMRKYAVGKDAAGRPRLMLNNKPYFHSGVLDQGYWPDGLYTAPSDEAMASDLLLMKQMGFNMIRKHIKVEPMRWYYHCDTIGLLVWQDMVNGGGQYGKVAISAPLVFGNSHSDHDYRYFAREDAAGRAAYRRELTDMVAQLYNCVSVCMWVPFNEGWGQFDARETADYVRSLDDTRTIDHASGWHDQGGGDLKSLHVYFKPYRFRRDRRGRAVALTEFGGYAQRVEGHCFSETAFGYRMYESGEALTEAFQKLYEREILPAREKGLSATVYTQLSDVEEETNGFVTYDRRVIKMPVEAVRALNEALIPEGTCEQK